MKNALKIFGIVVGVAVGVAAVVDTVTTIIAAKKLMDYEDDCNHLCECEDDKHCEDCGCDGCEFQDICKNN